MKKRIVSIFLCIALTMIPTLSLSATEAESTQSITSSPTVTTSPTKVVTETPTPIPTKSSSEDERKSISPVPTETVTPTPNVTTTPTPTADPTETPASTEESDESITPTPTETPTPSPTPTEEDPSIVKSLLKGLLRGPLRSPGDTTWQNDWIYTKDGSSIVLSYYTGTAETTLVVPASATIDGITYNSVKFKSNASDMFKNHSELVSIDLKNVDTSNVNNMGSMFMGCSRLESIDFTGFDTSNVTYMGGMFYGCSDLTNLDVTGFNTSKVTGMDMMFRNCGITSLDVTHFDTSQVTNMSYMFCGCSDLSNLDVTHFNTSNVNNMSAMFDGCSSLTSLDVTGFDTSNVTDMNSMFCYCSGLTSLDVTHFDTSNVQWMHGMFSDCSSLISLDVSGFDTGSAQSMNTMFYKCNSLTDIDVSGFDTTNVTSMNNMFAYCYGLTDIDVSSFDTSNVYSIEAMFWWCTGLTSLDLSGFDLTTCDAKKLIQNCTSLELIKTPTNLSQSVDLPGVFIEKDVTPITEYTSLPKNLSTSKILVRKVEPASITLDPTSKTISINEEFTITATVLPTTADQTVTWASDKPAVATVDTNGKVKGISVGVATITAKTVNNLSATCIVTVVNNPLPYVFEVVDNRTSPPHPDRVTASITVLAGNRYLIISDSDGNTIRPWIRADSSLKYDTMAVYDMRLTDSRTGGNDKTDFGTCTIRLALPSDMSISTGTIHLVTMKEGRLDKSLRFSLANVNGVPCITFTTDHFTDFAILYKKPDKKKEEPHDESDHHESHSDNTSQSVYNAPVQTNTVIVNRVLDNIPKTGDYRR